MLFRSKRASYDSLILLGKKCTQIFNYIARYISLGFNHIWNVSTDVFKDPTIKFQANPSTASRTGKRTNVDRKMDRCHDGKT
jgi:hypothetical protein